MVVTELVSQLAMFTLNVLAPLNMPLKSVKPDVHDVASSASFAAPSNANMPAWSRFVYKTPPRVNVPPTSMPGQRTVTPLESK